MRWESGESTHAKLKTSGSGFPLCFAMASSRVASKLCGMTAIWPCLL